MRLKQICPHGSLSRISFAHPEQTGISLEFAYRLDAYANHIGIDMLINSGHREYDYQMKLYMKNCKKHPPKGNGYVANPNVSWHPWRCAVDVGGSKWKKLLSSGDMHKTAREQDLYKFGLYLPLNYIDAKRIKVYEWWHIQPIEILSWSGGDKSKFLDLDDLIYGKDDGNMTIGEFQKATGLIADDIPGPDTVAKAKEVLDCIGDIFSSTAYVAPTLVVNGNKIDVKPFTVNDTNYVPVRALCEALGLKVSWDNTTKTITVNK